MRGAAICIELSKRLPLERDCRGGSFRPDTVQGAPMQYLLMIYRDEAALSSANKETVDQTMAAYAAYTEAMKKAGVYIGANRLKPTTSATTVRSSSGKT